MDCDTAWGKVEERRLEGVELKEKLGTALRGIDKGKAKVKDLREELVKERKEVTRLDDHNKVAVEREKSDRKLLETLGKTVEDLRSLRLGYIDATKDLRLQNARNLR